ncbi:hypothetical protein [Jiangella asiatica]|uniref:Uncharacterized protein n=1 Tax=Jiangella asiatica TaxID=2530372 RepID=A0A4R5DDJ6_9ACTN|nr:hypothetical protein [Jiangella asiatica]TDE08343.1 hypothetical protein E1269_17715 [Jiangella asiatica]
MFSHARSRMWRSGPWSLELRGDELADLAWKDRPVLRGVRAVLRDRDWRTGEWTLGPITGGDDGDTLEVPVRSLSFGAGLSGTLRVHARGGILSVEFDAVSDREFETNRTGLVVLHPPRLAGTRLTVTHPDGSRESTRFPADISPHQPASDIAALAWDDDGLRVAVEFTGDVFEMEDQRNWTDASFKTYSRPLCLPFPYRLAPGERVRQSVTVTVSGAPSVTVHPPRERIELTPDGPFPAVGVAASTAPDPEPDGLSRIGRSLLVELDLAMSTWPAELARAAGRGLPLDVRVILPVPPPGGLLHELARRLRTHAVLRVAAFGTASHVSEAVLVAALRDALTTAGATVPVVGGSRSHFTELNRRRGDLPDELAGLTVALTPLFHELSTDQLVESVAMQRLVARQTVSYARGTPVHVGPITLRPRFNDAATTGSEPTDAVDPRQQAPELAAWTIASAAALAVPGVASLTYFEEWGPRGVRSASCDPFPVATAISHLAAAAGARALHGESPDGLVWAVGARHGDHDVVFTSNLDIATRTIAVSLDGRERRVVLPALSWRSFQVTPATPGRPTARG